MAWSDPSEDFKVASPRFKVNCVVDEAGYVTDLETLDSRLVFLFTNALR